MKRTCEFLSMLAMLAMLCGCATVDWVKLSYHTPGNSGVALKQHAAARLMATGEQQVAQATLNRIAAEFNSREDSDVRIVLNENEPADYYIYLNINSAFRAPSAEEVPYNASKTVGEQDGTTRGRNIIVTTSGQPSSSGAGCVAVAIYSATKLEPVHYFEVPMYDGDFAVEGGKLRGNEQFVGSLVEQTGQMFSDMFLTQKRDINTAIPKKNADGALVKALRAGDVEAVEQRTQELLADSVDGYLAKAAAASKSAREKLEGGLCTCYLNTLAAELDNFDADTLQTVHERYTQILTLTADEGLAEACANALARVEQKAQMTGAKL